MTTTNVKRRRGGATLTVLVDLVRSTWWTRNWLVTIAIILAIVAALTATVGQTVLPWAIYPAL